MRKAQSAFLMPCVFETIGCASKAEIRYSTIRGLIYLSDAAAIEPEPDIVEISLMDVSKADVLAATISSRRVNVEQWPVAYSLIFEPLSIEDRMSYSIQARVLSPDGRLLAPRLLGAKRKSRV